MSIKRKLYYISILLCVSLLLSACSSKASQKTTAEIKESSTAVTATTAESTIDEELKHSVETESEFETKATIRINGKEISCAKFDKSNYLDILKLVIEKGNDWSVLPLSDEFRKNHKPEDGLIEKKDYEYADVYDGDSVNVTSFSKGQVRLEVLYKKPKYAHEYFDVFFTVNDKEQLESVEMKFDKEEEIPKIGEDSSDEPMYMNEEFYTLAVRAFSHKGENPFIDMYALTDRFKEDYKKREGKGFIPDTSYEVLRDIEHLSNYSEKRVVLDAIYSDKIIRYNAYFTTDSELRLDSITVEEESVRDREPESKAE